MSDKHVFLNRALFYLILAVLLYAPDALFFASRPHLPLCFAHEKTLIPVALGLLVSLIRPNAVVLAISGFFALCQAVQYCCLAYFGSALNPFTVSLLFEESEDVWSESLHVASSYWHIPLFAFVSYGLAAFWILKSKNRFTLPYAWLCPAAFFVFFAVQARISPDFLMNASCSAGFNTVTAVSAYFGKILPDELLKKENAAPAFKPYIVDLKEQKPNRNVVVIIGESLNRTHFSLYGYDRPTTPRLKARFENREKTPFIYKNALSGGVNTLVAVPVFLHLQREPLNYKKQFLVDTYLPKMAKQNGFDTAYVGMQGQAVYTKENLSFFDRAIVRHSEREKDFEHVLIRRALESLSFDAPLFLVIQKRNPHAPYDKKIPEQFLLFKPETQTESDARIAAYDNALAYEDFMTDDMLSLIERRSNRPTYVYYVSDHGEAMNEETGVFGHSFLKPAVLNIPFIFTLFHGNDAAHLNKISETFMPTGYEIGLLIAEKLGYSVTNPNQEAGVYYTNGNHKKGGAGYIRIKKDPVRKTVGLTTVENGSD